MEEPELQGGTYLVAPDAHPQLLLSSLGKGKRSSHSSACTLHPASCGQVNASSPVTSAYNGQGPRHVLRCLRQRWSTCLPLVSPSPHILLRVSVILVSSVTRGAQTAAGQIGLGLSSADCSSPRRHWHLIPTSLGWH